MPKVSVIMGMYNVSGTLSEALDSLFLQSYQDFDVILCDDGSEDNTLAVARGYAAQYPEKIVVLQNDRNEGLNKTLNKCLTYATGEYIARMDGDDTCSADRFLKQVEFLDDHPEFAIVGTAMSLFDENGLFGKVHVAAMPSKEDCIKGSPFCHATVMIRSSAYKAVGGYSIDRHTLRVEDVDLWIRMYEAGVKGYNIQEELYSMRDNRNAISRRKFVYRMNSTYTRIAGCKRLGLPLAYYIYAIRPVMIGLIPTPIYAFLHRRMAKARRK